MPWRIAPLYCALIVAYSILISCTMELGENARFKFMIEPVFIALTVIVAYRAFAKGVPRTAEVSDQV